MKKINEPYYTCELDIVHHIASVFHVIPNGSIPGRPDELIKRTAKTHEDFECVYDAQFKELKFRDQNLYLSEQINEFSQRVMELKMFDSHTFSEDIQLVHDYLNFLKSKENNKVKGVAAILAEVNSEIESLDTILKRLFPHISNSLEKLPNSLTQLKENLQGSSYNLASWNITYIGSKKDLEKELAKLKKLLDKDDRPNVKKVFEKSIMWKKDKSSNSQKLVFNKHL